jgi:hypothetical protein
MTDERSPPSELRGRLADVYVPALVSGTVEALSRRLGNRATIDDPRYGRASSLASIDGLLARVTSYFAEGGARYEHVYSTAGVDRDASEGRLALTIDGEARKVPIAVVAERRRLREIELRVYYAPPGSPVSRKHRPPLVSSGAQVPLPALVDSVFAGVRSGALERALLAFEEGASVVDPSGREHQKRDGTAALFLATLADVDVDVGGCADDGRTVCVETTVTRPGQRATPALFAFERGPSGLLGALRLYWE